VKRIIGDDRARLLSKIDQSGGPGACWPFTGAKNGNGYGNFWIKGQYLGAHRAAWLIMNGEIQDDLEIDHTCHNEDLDCPGGSKCPHRLCANWVDHLRIATHRDNDLAGRGQSAINVLKTHCPADHEYTVANTYWHGGHRYCRKCHARSERERRGNTSGRPIW
jgi:hypothetical protein